MNLIELIQAYDGCKRLELTKATANLEKLINLISKNTLTSLKEKIKSAKNAEVVA